MEESSELEAEENQNTINTMIEEPYDFLESEKKQNRDRIFLCDEIKEMMTKEEKEA